MTDGPATARIADTIWTNDVYEPSDDTFLLVDAVIQDIDTISSEKPLIGVEIGPGSGFVLCTAALALKRAGLSTQFLAADINPAAAECTRATCTSHGISSEDCIVCDLLEPLRPRIDGTVDLLLFNPPYVPTPEEEITRGGIAAAWAGGERGRVVIDRVMPQVPDLLSPRGRMYMIALQENDPEEIMESARAMGLQADIVLHRVADQERLCVIRIVRQG